MPFPHLERPTLGSTCSFADSTWTGGHEPIGCSLTPIALGGTSAWAHNSAVECVLHTDEVAGSNPAAPTKTHRAISRRDRAWNEPGYEGKQRQTKDPGRRGRRRHPERFRDGSRRQVRRALHGYGRPRGRDGGNVGARRRDGRAKTYHPRRKRGDGRSRASSTDSAPSTTASDPRYQIVGSE